MDTAAVAILIALCAGFATVVGAGIAIVFSHHMRPVTFAAALSFAAGCTLMVAFADVMPEGKEAWATSMGGGHHTHTHTLGSAAQTLAHGIGDPHAHSHAGGGVHDHGLELGDGGGGHVGHSHGDVKSALSLMVVLGGWLLASLFDLLLHSSLDLYERKFGVHTHVGMCAHDHHPSDHHAALLVTDKENGGVNPGDQQHSHSHSHQQQPTTPKGTTGTTGTAGTTGPKDHTGGGQTGGGHTGGGHTGGHTGGHHEHQAGSGGEVVCDDKTCEGGVIQNSIFIDHLQHQHVCTHQKRYPAVNEPSPPPGTESPPGSGGRADFDSSLRNSVSLSNDTTAGGGCEDRLSRPASASASSSARGRCYNVIKLIFFGRSQVSASERRKLDEDFVRDAKSISRLGYFTACVLALHNIPEGIALYGTATIDTKSGVGLAIAIALHNFPQGMAIAVPIYIGLGSAWKALMFASAAALAQPLGALIGYTAVGTNPSNLVMAVMLLLTAGILLNASLKELYASAIRYDKGNQVVGPFMFLGMAVMAATLVVLAMV